MDDLITGENQNFGITFSNTPGYEQAFPTFKFSQFALYLQDEMNLGSRLKVTAGIRFDLPTYPEPLASHTIIDTLHFGENVYSTSTLPKERIMVSPDRFQLCFKMISGL